MAILCQVLRFGEGLAYTVDDNIEDDVHIDDYIRETNKDTF